ncbi:hypothetical protein PROFUN_04526 [Planoprotostelium fungivorum]|uniref:Uncharacterized protein n=1 Tax=Planoprotostelium fungivorum TaxID=1890364 RepID=A0A2P6NBH5_9EUKA|nr:hypothetical protein PROFUN_04526 [Planoprotostelium fungivorum]
MLVSLVSILHTICTDKFPLGPPETQGLRRGTNGISTSDHRHDQRRPNNASTHKSIYSPFNIYPLQSQLLPYMTKFYTPYGGHMNHRILKCSYGQELSVLLSFVQIDTRTNPRIYFDVLN